VTSFLLTSAEVRELTGRTRRPTQVHTLRAMGIEHRVRPDGSVAVLRAHAEHVLGGRIYADVSEKRHEPNWSAI